MLSMMNGQSSITVSTKTPALPLCGALATRTLTGSARMRKTQRIRAELRALLGGQPGSEVGREPAKETGGENVEPARMLARGVGHNGVRLCFAGQDCHLEKSKVAGIRRSLDPDIIGRVPPAAATAR